VIAGVGPPGGVHGEAQVESPEQVAGNRGMHMKVPLEHYLKRLPAAAAQTRQKQATEDKLGISVIIVVISFPGCRRTSK
jgi:hypothetical protein